jgi:hypothetical protein
MAYIINKFNGEQLIVLDDGTIDTSTSVGLVGRNYVGYGETQNENFVYLLENFANDSPPSRPLTGQIWFNTTNSLAYIYNGAQWTVIGSAAVSSTAPTEPNLGSLWINTAANQLSIWTGAGWSFIGPEAVPGFGITRARSASILDSTGNNKPVIYLEINDSIIAICTNESFTIDPSATISGFENNLIAGINLSSNTQVNGNLTGRAGSANRLSTARFINGVAFDGQQDITVKSSTPNKLIKGTYIAGTDFDGSTATTWSVDATPSNVIGKIVARNSEGGFSAGTISATFVGDLTGNVVAATGTSRFNVVEANSFIGATLSGNANSASQLATARKINGVNFNGTNDITVTAAAETLTGNTLNSTVLNSNLTSVGTLANLAVSNLGITVGGASELQVLIDSSRPTIRSSTGILNFDMGTNGPDVSFVNASTSLSLGGPNAPAIIGENITNIGIVGHKFDKVFANEFKGNADTATSATTALNIFGGGAGALVYQTGVSTTSSLGIGPEGFVLKSRAGQPLWESISFENLTKGNFLTFVNSITQTEVSVFNSSSPVTLSVDATSNNTSNKVVARDSSGNFSAGTITANLTGNVTGNISGNSGTATRLQNSRTINGVAFDGTANITISATDNSKVPLTGGTMLGHLTLNGDPLTALHAAPKQYVDSRLPQYTFTFGNTVYSTSGYTNQVGSWNDGANFFDVFPPSGKSMGNLIAFIPSIAVIHYAGGVDANDSMRCTWSNLGNRIRVYVQNTEQRSTPAANYLAIWS